MSSIYVVRCYGQRVHSATGSLWQAKSISIGLNSSKASTHTLGLGAGPGDPRPVLLMLHPPFLLADGGVLQRAPVPVLYLTAVGMRAAALLLSPPLCDATDAILSSASNLVKQQQPS